MAHNVESTSALTVEAHGFSEWLGDNHFEALGNEVAETLGINIEITWSEALIGGVEEGVKLVLLADLSDFFPFVKGGVNASGIVSAGVEQDAWASGSSCKVGEHALEVKTFSGGFVVTVLSNLDASSAEDWVMVSPGGVADVKGSWAELGEEFSNDAESTSAG